MASGQPNHDTQTAFDMLPLTCARVRQLSLKRRFLSSFLERPSEHRLLMRRRQRAEENAVYYDLEQNWVDVVGIDSERGGRISAFNVWPQILLLL